MPHRRLPRWLFRHRKPIAFLVFTLGAVGIGVWLILLTGRVNRVEATRVATIQARYSACVSSIPILRQINAAFAGGRDFARAQLLNAEAMHRIAEPGSEVYRQQTVNIARTRAAIRRGGRVTLPVPTRKVCEQRRDAELSR